MIRLALWFILIILAAAAAAWLADRPGEIMLTWQGYRMETSIMVAALALALLLMAALILFWIIHTLLIAPGAVSGFFRSRRQRRGYQSLSRGMIAVGAGNARAAARFAGEAERALGDEPLMLLLKAQTAQLRGDRETARATFESMLARSETQTVGLRGLYVEAQRAGNALAAQGFAERALAADPATPWAAQAVFDMLCAAGDWAGALQRLQASNKHGLVDKDSFKRQRAVLLTAQAMDAEDADDAARALALALEAHGLAPDLVPAAVIAGRLLAHQGNPRKAMRVLEKSWKLQPHPDIAEAFAHVRPGDSARDRLKRLRRLEQATPGSREAAFAVAEAQIDAREWNAARATLKPVAQEAVTTRLCALMARIEEGQYGDRGRAREWMARAMQAPRDPAWTADGVVAGEWAPTSPVTGRLDAFAWKVPVERLDGMQAEPDMAAMLEPLPVPKPAPAPRRTPVPEPLPEPPIVPKPEPEPATAIAETKPRAKRDEAGDKARPDERGVDVTPPAAPAGDKKDQPQAKAPARPSNRAATPAAATARTPPPVGDETLTAVHAPDDPGPDGLGLDDEDRAAPRPI